MTQRGLPSFSSWEACPETRTWQLSFLLLLACLQTTPQWAGGHLLMKPQEPHHQKQRGDPEATRPEIFSCLAEPKISVHKSYVSNRWEKAALVEPSSHQELIRLIAIWVSETLPTVIQVHVHHSITSTTAYYLICSVIGWQQTKKKHPVQFKTHVPKFLNSCRA